jgi:hypothetical protein
VIGDGVRRNGVDLRDRLGAAIGGNLLKRFQSSFNAADLGGILCGAFSGLLGDQPAQSLFMFEPSPKPDPNYREQRNPEDRFHQKRFLEGENVDDAVVHINLLTCTAERALMENDRLRECRTYALVMQYSNAAIPTLTLAI